MQKGFIDYEWRAKDLEPNSWVRLLDDDIISEITAAFEKAKLLSDSVDIGIDLLKLPKTAKFFNDIADEIENGRGFIVIRGFPVNLYSVENLCELLLGLTRHLGTPVFQNKSGSLIGRIEDLGKDISKRTVRGHQTRAALPFHCDRADTIGLLCIRTAKEGGESRLVSAVAVHNVIAKEQPDLLSVLYSDFPHDRRGEEASGEAPWIPLPIFAIVNQRFVSRYVRRFVESTSLLNAPPLSESQLKALNFVDEVIQRPGMVLDLDFMPGDLQLLNNYTIWHSRNEFNDWETPEQRRLLLRLWLSSPISRKLPESFRPLYGTIEPGAIRGGVSLE